ncbi:MAG: N-acetylmuramoyl-L-alanine amidase [Sedimentisphaerales bacterium]|nr:N-acetylmuramoyl-L-alanine amidase [Sedimentisphaerales bacterium]
MVDKSGGDGRYLYFAAILSALWIGTGCRSNQSYKIPEPQVRPAQWSVTIPAITKPGATAASEFPLDWMPPGHLENKKRWEGIIIHHSADEFGDAAIYDRVHRKRGWDSLGYHFVINNGNGSLDKKDGMVEVGTRWRQQIKGAHCRVNPNDDNYWNEHTIGICLVGNFEQHPPSEAQWQSLVKLLRFLQLRYQIPLDKIITHRDVKVTKCPGKYFTLSELHQRLKE